MHYFPRRSPTSLLTLFLLLSAALASSIASAFPRDRRQFFTTCWGWGAGCSMHNAVGRALTATDNSNSQAAALRRQPANSHNSRYRHYVGIPSIVTSGGWEPGTMGKRSAPRLQSLLAILECAVPGKGL
ncbi:hypothetical protein BsWGS_28678 [Bradybaena similaris]